MTNTHSSASQAHMSRYNIQSSDVLSDMRINVFEEGSQSVVWYKERFLGDEEVVENIVENATSTILWTVHRPQRGWYIRIRAPTFPPGAYISLEPFAPSSPYSSDTTLTFLCRTNAPTSHSVQTHSAASTSKSSVDSDTTLTDGQRESVHSYPPTPSIPSVNVNVHPPSPRSMAAKLEEVPLSSRPRRAHLTRFVLTMDAESTQGSAPQSVFSRVISALKSVAPSRSLSFTLSTMSAAPQAPQSMGDTSIRQPVPFLTYHDRTLVWTVGSTSGLIELDKSRERELGVHTSFYIAVALTYLQYLDERESYLAAATD